MNTIYNKIDDLNYQVTLEVSKEDYEKGEKKYLAERKRTADFKGFRKGMAPMSLIQRVYGEHALVEAVNEVISEGLNNFIKDNNLKLIGEPLASEDQPEIEWNDGNDFVFKFDLAQTPEITLDITKDDKVPSYNINVTAEAKKEMKENMLRQFGDLQEAEKAGADDFVVVDFENDSHTAEGVYVSVRSVSGDAAKKFKGAKSGDKFDVNVNEAFTNEADRAAMLKVKKEALETLDPVFHVSVVNVKTFVPAEENQDTYDKIFGPDKVHNADEFDAAVAERLTDNYKQESDYRLSKDIKDYVIKKADLQLPEAFLKRWIKHVNGDKFSDEQIDKEFEAFLADFRWQMIRDHFVEKYGVKVDDSDMHEAAESYAAYQYAMYGMGNVPHELIHDAAHRMLDDERQAARIFESVEDQKVMAELKKNIGVTSKKISVEKFREL